MPAELYYHSQTFFLARDLPDDRNDDLQGVYAACFPVRFAWILGRISGPRLWVYNEP